MGKRLSVRFLLYFRKICLDSPRTASAPQSPAPIGPLFTRSSHLAVHFLVILSTSLASAAAHSLRPKITALFSARPGFYPDSPRFFYFRGAERWVFLWLLWAPTCAIDPRGRSASRPDDETGSPAFHCLPALALQWTAPLCDGARKAQVAASHTAPAPARAHSVSSLPALSQATASQAKSLADHAALDARCLRRDQGCRVARRRAARPHVGHHHKLRALRGASPPGRRIGERAARRGTAPSRIATPARGGSVEGHALSRLAVGCPPSPRTPSLPRASTMRVQSLAAGLGTSP